VGFTLQSLTLGEYGFTLIWTSGSPGFAVVERITPCLRNLPPVFRHFPRTAIRKPDSLTAPSVYRKPDGKLLANPHGTLPRKHPFF
jgi:hypothetical protein